MTKLAMDSFYAEAHFKIDYGFLYKIGDGFPVHTNSNVKMDEGVRPHTFTNIGMTKSAMDFFYTRIPM